MVIYGVNVYPNSYSQRVDVCRVIRGVELVGHSHDL